MSIGMTIAVKVGTGGDVDDEQDKPLTVSNLITTLQEILAKEGDLPIYGADREGYFVPLVIDDARVEDAAPEAAYNPHPRIVAIC